MASAIEDVNSLPGETVNDQDGRKIGKVKDLYSVGDNDAPMWVTVESAVELGNSRLLFIPIARLKQEAKQLRVPYSFQHVHGSPEVEAGEELSEADDRVLRDYYAIGLADQETRSDNDSYASLVPDGKGPAKKVEGEAGEPQSGNVEAAPSANGDSESSNRIGNPLEDAGRNKSSETRDGD